MSEMGIPQADEGRWAQKDKYEDALPVMRQVFTYINQVTNISSS